ncbi:hypothetical protein B0T22DRAFT_156131 [Podospora appendiculata]|uniref:Uncharacterized protein n=1 Tax=Podospora appendiculata TaxID=314037 RepID=A0AAE0X9T9_9PEZI|nr:hypothetical protein B0T22DRAFT_156131 [Podospora appendiculata]
MSTAQYQKCKKEHQKTSNPPRQSSFPQNSTTKQSESHQPKPAKETTVTPRTHPICPLPVFNPRVRFRFYSQLSTRTKHPNIHSSIHPSTHLPIYLASVSNFSFHTRARRGGREGRGDILSWFFFSSRKTHPSLSQASQAAEPQQRRRRSRCINQSISRAETQKQWNTKAMEHKSNGTQKQWNTKAMEHKSHRKGTIARPGKRLS